MQPIVTEQEKDSSNYQTLRHIESVRNLINLCVTELLKRGQLHDQEKMKSPEVEYFAKYTPILNHLTYGSPEYQESLNQLNTALKHHYCTYRHHPEHFPNGIHDMNLIDVLEMFCDWVASSKRHNDGNILKSIDINKERFNMPDELVSIMRNTAAYFEQLSH